MLFINTGDSNIFKVVSHILSVVNLEWYIPDAVTQLVLFVQTSLWKWKKFNIFCNKYRIGIKFSRYIEESNSLCLAWNHNHYTGSYQKFRSLALSSSARKCPIFLDTTLLMVRWGENTLSFPSCPYRGSLGLCPYTSCYYVHIVGIFYLWLEKLPENKYHIFALGVRHTSTTLYFYGASKRDHTSPGPLL